MQDRRGEPVKAAQVPGADTPPLSELLVLASRQVAAVLRGQSLADQRFDHAGSGRAAVRDLVYGTLRRHGRGDAQLRVLSTRDKLDPPMRSLLLCALYALESGRYSEHTAVDQSVRAAVSLGMAPAKGFVNAVLRSRSRRLAELEAAVAADPVALAMHPRWWIDLLGRQHPAEAERILDAGNTHPPMGLRVNLRRGTTAACLAALELAGMPARVVGPSALVLERPVPVDRLPGFAQGALSVQDAGAQHAGSLLDLQDGQRVLDACAAPGGKAGQMLELARVELTALDIGAARCTRVRDNLARLGLQAQVLQADCTDIPAWWDGRPFDRILADVPCTGSGVVRRHPDIKWLRRPGDAAQFAHQQGRILDALWRVLSPGGKLLYATCSVFSEENDNVVAAFLRRQPDAAPAAPAGAAFESWLLPGPDHDGFYYAVLGKSA